MKETIKALIREWRNNATFCVLKLVNFFVKKNRQHIFFIPNGNCKNDNYDILNYAADNVLIVCHSILTDNRFVGSYISLLVYHPEKISQYKQYCNRLSIAVHIDFVPFNRTIANIMAFCKASLIVTDNYYLQWRYKTNRQIVLSLGYYAFPFKDDYFKISSLGYKRARRKERQMNKLFDYHASTSLFSSREISVDSLIYLPKFVTLGLPRNDIFYCNKKKYRDKIVDLIGFSPKTIIVHVPTHRDYERKTSVLYEEEMTHKHTLFGHVAIEEELAFDAFLEKEDIVIIAKTHPFQERSVIIQERRNRILYYSDLIKSNCINLQEMMAASDILITDYSTACYDYLLTDRPVIFNLYDYETMRIGRSFFIDPVTSFLAGDIVYNIKELMIAINNNIENPNRNIEKRHMVRDLIFNQQDGQSTNRVKDFLLTLVKEL